MAGAVVPESRLRQRRRTKRWWSVVGVVVIVLLSFAALVLLSRAPFLQVSAIQVEGARAVATSTLVQTVEDGLEGNYLYLFSKRNIFLYPRKALAAALLGSYPILERAEVRAENFHTISVTLSERQAVALWCGESFEEPVPCKLMDEGGVVYASAPEYSAPIYISYFGAASSTIPAQYLNRTQFQSLSALAAAVAPKVPTEVLESVSVDKEGDGRMHFRSGFVLLFVAAEDSGDVFERFSLALTAVPFTDRSVADFHYLDLRFGDKLYYKIRD